MIETKKPTEKTVLVSVLPHQVKDYKLHPLLEEFKFLAVSAGAEVKGFFTQKLEKPHYKYFVGPGKLQELKTYIEVHEIDTAIFDGELSASQMRNIEEVLQIKVLDRTNLILDIFALRAQSAQAKTQVELAQYQYLLPRLTGLWTHLSRQKGGIGMKGPGEKEIETDKRIIQQRISFLKEKLVKIDKQNGTRRKDRSQFVRVSLVGYTNAGKSTLMNLISKSEILAEDKLFATLDTTVRKVKNTKSTYLISDTVGFIKNLPHSLIESFKSTLDEVKESDILIHVVDISSPEFEENIRVVQETLIEIGAEDKPTIYIFNKIDGYYSLQLELEQDQSLPNIEKFLRTNTYIGKDFNPSVFVSALHKYNLDRVRNVIGFSVRKIEKENLKKYQIAMIPKSYE